MRDTIKKIEFYPSSKIKDYSFYQPGSLITLGSFTEGTPIDLGITAGKSDFESVQQLDSVGKYYDMSVNAQISSKEDAYQKLAMISATKGIYIVTGMSNAKYVIGSLSFPATLLFNRTSTDLSLSTYTINITCKAPHGFYMSV